MNGITAVDYEIGARNHIGSAAGQEQGCQRNFHGLAKAPGGSIGDRIFMNLADIPIPVSYTHLVSAVPREIFAIDGISDGRFFR